MVADAISLWRSPCQVHQGSHVRAGPDQVTGLGPSRVTCTGAKALAHAARDLPPSQLTVPVFLIARHAERTVKMGPSLSGPSKISIV